MSRLGVITGMAVEAAQFNQSISHLNDATRPLVASVGGNAAEAENAARRFAAEGVSGLVSFGIAGGLDPARRPGDLVLAERICLPDGSELETDTAWTHSVTDSFPTPLHVTHGAIAGSDRAVTSTEAKIRLHSQTGAIAVDMESHGVARAARAVNLPFIAVRAIADPASRSIPEAALAGIGPHGERRPFAVLTQLAKKPQQLWALMRVANDSNRAMKSLRTAAPSIFLYSALPL